MRPKQLSEETQTNMKRRIFLCALLLAGVLLAAPAAQAGDGGTREPRVRFGIGYRYSLALTEWVKVETPILRSSVRISPEWRRGGSLHLEGTVRITRDWNVGAGFGFGSFDDASFKRFLVYAKAERLYGMQRSRWFNYAEAGVTCYPDNGTGFTGSLGGGYRLALTRRTRMDFTAGLQYLNMVGSAFGFDNTGEYYYFEHGGRVNRLALTFGIAMHF